MFEKLLLELREVAASMKGLLRAPQGTVLESLGFWEDADGNVRYIKGYQGSKVIFTLTFTDAGAALTETWRINRS